MTSVSSHSTKIKEVPSKDSGQERFWQFGMLFDAVNKVERKLADRGRDISGGHRMFMVVAQETVIV